MSKNHENDLHKPPEIMTCRVILPLTVLSTRGRPLHWCYAPQVTMKELDFRIEAGGSFSKCTGEGLCLIPRQLPFRVIC